MGPDQAAVIVHRIEGLWPKATTPLEESRAWVRIMISKDEPLSFEAAEAVLDDLVKQSPTYRPTPAQFVARSRARLGMISKGRTSAPVEPELVIDPAMTRSWIDRIKAENPSIVPSSQRTNATA